MREKKRQINSTNSTALKCHCGLQKKEKKKKENHILIWGKDLSPLSISRVSFLFILFFF